LWDVIHQREPIKRAACASCFAAIIVRSPVSTSKWNQSIYLKLNRVFQKNWPFVRLIKIDALLSFATVLTCRGFLPIVEIFHARHDFRFVFPDFMQWLQELYPRRASLKLSVQFVSGAKTHD
jgi:hypothetical protein